MKKPTFLIQGMDWTPASAGIRALHKLCEMLREEGEEACLSPCKLKDGSQAKISDMVAIDEYPRILIMPEIFGGIHEWAELTVRWLLNLPGKVSENRIDTWGNNDLLAHFDERFRLNDSIPLAVPHVDRSTFNNEKNPDNKKRVIDCFYAKKALVAGEDRKIPAYAIDVSPDAGIVPIGDSKKLASLFRRTETFYTMEDTATSIEAALCGAKVEYIASQYMPHPPPIKDLSIWYTNLEKRSKKEVINFIEVCYMRLGLKRDLCAA